MATQGDRIEALESGLAALETAVDEAKQNIADLSGKLAEMESGVETTVEETEVEIDGTPEFIRLEDTRGNTHVVNVGHIVRVMRKDERHTSVTVSGVMEPITVRSKAEDVWATLNAEPVEVSDGG